MEEPEDSLHHKRTPEELARDQAEWEDILRRREMATHRNNTIDIADSNAKVVRIESSVSGSEGSISPGRE